MRSTPCADAIGMGGTTHRHGIPPNGLSRDHPIDATNTTTAADVGLLLELILRGTSDADAASRLGMTPELCQLAIDILSWQKLRARLPSMLPEGTKVAHKTGTGARDCNDAGIVYRDGEALFILSVYTDSDTPDLDDGRALRLCRVDTDRASCEDLLRRAWIIERAALDDGPDRRSLVGAVGHIQVRGFDTDVAPMSRLHEGVECAADQ